MTSYGNPEYAPGGKGIKFAASVRLEVRKAESIKSANGDEIGQLVKLKTAKNKTSSPFKSTEVKLLFGKGFQNSYCLAKLGEEHEIIKKAGAWYSLESGEKFQGMNALVERLEEDVELAKSIKDQILKVV